LRVVDTRVVQAGATVADQRAGLALGGCEARAVERICDLDAGAQLAARDLGAA
jgi:hypothetical protein